MAVITNFDTLQALHDSAMACGAGRRDWIKFADTMIDSFPGLYRTAKAMNSRSAELEKALRDLLNHIELSTDCVDGHIDRAAPDDQVEAAERLVGTRPGVTK